MPVFRWRTGDGQVALAPAQRHCGGERFGWRLKKINIEISPGFTPAAIAKDIIGWAKR